MSAIFCNVRCWPVTRWVKGHEFSYVMLADAIGIIRKYRVNCMLTGHSLFLNLFIILGSLGRFVVRLLGWALCLCAAFPDIMLALFLRRTKIVSNNYDLLEKWFRAIHVGKIEQGNNLYCCYLNSHQRTF